MAGLLGKCRYCRPLLALMTLVLVGTVLITTNVWNPLPQLSSWWAKFTVLSTPAPAWDARADGVPDLAAALPGGQVIVVSRGFVDAYRADSGQRVWHYDAYWALPAGDVVVLHQRSKNPDQDTERDRGYSVVNPADGTVIWADHEAKAVWVFADRIIDLGCPDGSSCVLRARAHRDGGRALWSVAVPGSLRVLSGADETLADTRDPAGWFAKAANGTPDPLPPVIGLVAGGRIQVVDTVDGVLVREVSPADRQIRAAISGERILLSGAAPVDSGCRFWLDAVNVRSGQTQWHSDGLNLDTASGAGCEQRRDPLGAGQQLVAINQDNQPVLLAADTGAQAWVGVPGDRVLATDGELAVIQGADRKTVRVIDLLAEGGPTVWSEQLGLKVEAAVTRTRVIIRDADKGRILVLDHRPVGKLLDVKTKATVVGYGPNGLVLASGRRIGFIPVGG